MTIIPSEDNEKLKKKPHIKIGIDSLKPIASYQVVLVIM